MKVPKYTLNLFLERVRNKYVNTCDSLYTYGGETLIHNCNDLIDLTKQLECSQLDHNCDNCKDYYPAKYVKSFGGIDKFRFI